MTSEPKIDRSQTAIRRYRCSRPVALAIAQGLIDTHRSVFDYGCGHGEDVEYLKKQGIRVSGWDPSFAPEESFQEAEVVNLGFVLNVIEDPAERHATLKKAFSLARQLLIVSVRVDRTPAQAVDFNDGQMTSRGTFQKIFSQAEFREYVQVTLGRRAYPATLGVVYVFADDAAESAYIANQALLRRVEYRAELINQFARDRIARRYVKLAVELGRPPLKEEFSSYAKLLERFGSPRRIERLTLGQIDPERLIQSQDQKREDILTYLSMLRLQGLRPPSAATLPGGVYADIRAIWGKYRSALEAADVFLFKIGQPDAIGEAFDQAPTGKRVNDTLYIHRSAEDALPPLLRLVVFAGKQIVGDTGYNVLKLWWDGRKVAFLTYDRFDEDAHPALRNSVRAQLPTTDYGIRDYSDSLNPPILHRKETLVFADYPGFEKFRALTETEEKLGLLSREGIGYRKQWEETLSQAGVTLAGHRLTRRANGGK